MILPIWWNTILIIDLLFGVNLAHDTSALPYISCDKDSGINEVRGRKQKYKKVFADYSANYCAMQWNYSALQNYVEYRLVNIIIGCHAVQNPV